MEKTIKTYKNAPWGPGNMNFSGLPGLGNPRVRSRLAHGPMHFIGFYILFIGYYINFDQKNFKKWAPGAPGKKNWPPDKNLASGGRAGAKFLSGDHFFKFF